MRKGRDLLPRVININSLLRGTRNDGKVQFLFFKSFLLVITKLSFWRWDWAVGYRPMKFGQYPDISYFRMLFMHIWFFHRVFFQCTEILCVSFSVHLLAPQCALAFEIGQQNNLWVWFSNWDYDSIMCSVGLPVMLFLFLLMYDVHALTKNFYR